MCNASSLATRPALCPSPTLCLKGILVKAGLPGLMDSTALPGMGLHRRSTVFISISPAPRAVWLEPHWSFGYFPNMPGPHTSQGLETLSHITGFYPCYLLPHLSSPFKTHWNSLLLCFLKLLWAEDFPFFFSFQWPLLKFHTRILIWCFSSRRLWRLVARSIFSPSTEHSASPSRCSANTFSMRRVNVQ